MFKCRNQEFLNPKKPFSIPRRNKYFWFNFYHFSNTSDYGKVNCSWLQINPIFNGSHSLLPLFSARFTFIQGVQEWQAAGDISEIFMAFPHSAEGFMDFSHPMCMPAKPFCCCNVERKVSNQLSSFVGKKMFNMHGLINDKAIKSFFFHLL